MCTGWEWRNTLSPVRAVCHLELRFERERKEASRRRLTISGAAKYVWVGSWILETGQPKLCCKFELWASATILGVSVVPDKGNVLIGPTRYTPEANPSLRERTSAPINPINRIEHALGGHEKSTQRKVEGRL